MSIGSTIKKIRREREMTQEQLAEYLGITANAVSQWECDRTAPDIAQLPILARVLQVSTDRLLGVDFSKDEEEIRRISDLCGFANERYFATCFRKRYGTTPSQQRKAHQKCH